MGMRTLLCLGVLRPGYGWLFACRLKATYSHIRELADPEFFAQALAHYQATGHRQRHQLDALNHLSRVMLHTGRGPRQLTAADLLDLDLPSELRFCRARGKTRTPNLPITRTQNTSNRGLTPQGRASQKS